jgi:competence protein ComEA
MRELPLVGHRLRAAQTARADARLHALSGGRQHSAGWAPPEDADREVPLPDFANEATPPDRWWLSPAALAGVVGVLVVAVLLAVLLAWRARAREVDAALAPPQAPQPVGVPSETGTTGRVVVDVAGRVRHPGLVTLPAGSRVADALRAAGGATPGTDLTSLNLARKLVDGEQILVGVPSVAAGAAESAGPTSPVDLNTASVAELDALPGVGPVLAQRIVDWRTAHGGFTSVSQLRQISGIGDSKFADLQPLVRL